MAATFAWLAGGMLAMSPLLGASCDDLVQECQANCDVEAECGFRSVEECQAASCDPLTGALLASGADACLAEATDCAEAAACACDEGCTRLDECADSGTVDESCPTTCTTLVEQEPTRTYLENRCRIEADDCGTLPTCSAVSG